MRFRAFWVDWDTLFFFENFREREAQNARERSEQDASVLVRLNVSKFHKKIILIFRNCVCCERLWPLRSSNLVSHFVYFLFLKKLRILSPLIFVVFFFLQEISIWWTEVCSSYYHVRGSPYLSWVYWNYSNSRRGSATLPNERGVGNTQCFHSTHPRSFHGGRVNRLHFYCEC